MKKLLLILIILTACSSTKDKKEDIPAQTVESLYNSAKDALDEGKYKEANKLFEEVEKRYPLSPWAKKAKIMTGYAYYKGKDYDNAVYTMQRYIKFHPDSKDTAYAYYLIALSYYMQITDIERDQKITEQALVALKQVVNRYPNTNYGKDAKMKIDLVMDHLAGKEMEIGRFYLNKRNYVGAMNRFKYVINNYQTTSHIPESLHRMVECYLSLGVRDEAKKYAATLGYNYPDNEWYKRSYELLKNQ